MEVNGETFESPEVLLAEEEGLVLSSVDESVCYRLGSSVIERGIADQLPIVVAVFLGAREVFHVGLPGTAANNDAIVYAKRNVAGLNGHASLYERNERLARGTTFEVETGLTRPEYAGFGGAVPIRNRAGELSAVVVVSGLTQEEDHDLAVQAIKALALETSADTVDA